MLALTKAAFAGDFVVSGQTGTVNSAGNGFPCFPSPDAFDAYWDAKSSGDTYGMAEAREGAILLRPGWRLRMLGSDNSGRHSRVRIETGPKAGAACWLKFNPAGIVNT